jgi:hypothetical protein
MHTAVFASPFLWRDWLSRDEGKTRMRIRGEGDDYRGKRGED